MKFKIQPKIIKDYPTLIEAIVILKNIDNTIDGKKVLKLLRQEEAKKKKELEGVNLSEHKCIKPWREAFKAFGSKPNKYSSSIEALLKRVQKGQELPDINPLVNLYNYCSINHMLPFGGEDFSGVCGDMELAYCSGTEEFIPILSKENEPPDKGEISWCDDKGVTCRKWNWRQCDRTKVTEKTKEGYFIIDVLPPATREQVEKAAEDFIALAKKYLKVHGEVYWLDRKNPEVEIDIETKKLTAKDKILRQVQDKKKFKTFEKQTEKPESPFADLVDESLVKYQLRGIVYDAIKKCRYVKYIKEDEVEIEHPQLEKFGDFATNVAMVLAKKMKKNPKEIAEKIKEQIETESCRDLIHQVSIVGAFINFKLKKTWLIKQVANILEKEEGYGLASKRRDKRVIIEFGQPNTHKMPHIGHLFSYILGESIARLVTSQGFQVFRANYQGDVGPHVAKCIWALQKKKLKIPKSLGEKADLLQLMYQEGSKAYKEDEKAKEEINEINKKIYKKDPSMKKLWEETRGWSVDFYKQFEKKLGLKYDRYYFESEAAEPGKKIVESNVGEVFKKSQGAIIFEGSNYGLHDRVFVTKHGTPTYEAKDMALQEIKYKEWPFDKMIITTAHEQNEYFKVVIKALEMLDEKFKDKIFHFGFGMVSLKGGKMSSREGRIISGVELIDMGVQGVVEIIRDRKGLSETEKSNIAEVVGIGAIKYSFLKNNPLHDSAFDFEESISFEGNSGPYLQYTYARANAIFRDTKNYSLDTLDKLNNYEEIAILRTLYKFPEIVIDATANLAPNLLCSYLFDLAQKFNLFYKKHKVLKAESKELREARLALTAAVAQVIKKGLYLLGIEVLEKM